jgi:hypothetical protein
VEECAAGAGRDRIVNLAGSGLIGRRRSRPWSGLGHRPLLRGACARVGPSGAANEARDEGRRKGREWTTEDEGPTWRWARRGGDGPARARASTHPRPRPVRGTGPLLPLSCTCCAVVRRTYSSSLQRLQGRMRGSSAAGRAEFYQLRTPSSGM